jgi:NAD(P)-dependent dehydrogenase (short-subunit alcohol dehydrogenase family)
MTETPETSHSLGQAKAAAVATEPFVDFQGRKVIVTGASSGIGRATAVELSRRGANVILMGRSHDGLKRTKELTAQSDAPVAALDFTDIATILPRIRQLVQEHGRIYGLCHCAGIVETRPLNAFQPDTFRAMLEVNLLAGIELARVVSRRDVITEEGGSILFISSIYGWVGMPGQIGYSATKGALLAAARAMAVELSRRRIRVNTLSPGLVRTSMTDKALSMLSPDHVRELESGYPLGVGSPQDVASAAVFLLAPQSRWITGTDLVIDGGYTAR